MARTSFRYVQVPWQRRIRAARSKQEVKLARHHDLAKIVAAVLVPTVQSRGPCLNEQFKCCRRDRAFGREKEFAENSISQKVAGPRE